MRKWLVVVLVVLAVVVSVMGFAAARLDGFLTAHRKEIARRIGAAIGRTVAFDGVGVSLRHGVGMRLDKLRIADGPAFGRTDFLSVDRVDVRVKLLPLLSRRVEVSRVLLDQPIVNLVRSDKGLNLSSLAGGDAAQTGVGGSEPAATALAVTLLNIRDGRLNYVDTTVSPPSRATVEHLDVEASDIDRARPIVFEIAAAVLGSEEHNLQVSGSIGPFLTGDLDRMPLDVALKIDRVTVDELARVPGLAAVLPPELRMDGSVAIKAKVSGTAAEPRVSAVLDARNPAIEYGDRFTKPAGVPLEVEFHAVLRGRELHLDKARLTLDRSAMDIGGTIATDAPAAYDLDVNTESIALSGWDKMFPSVAGTTLEGRAAGALRISGNLGAPGLPQINGTLALTDVGLRGDGIPTLRGLTTRATFRGHSLVLAPADLTLGGSSVRFAADVKDLATPLAHFTLSSAALALAGLGVRDAKSKTPETVNGLEIEGTLAMAKGPELDATLSSSAGRVRDVEYSHLSGRLHYTAGRARLDPMSVQAFGGHFDGVAVYELGSHGKEPKFTMHGKVREVRLPQVFEYAGVPVGDRVFDGLFDADLEVSGAGSAWGAIRKALTGTGSIEIRDGKLKRINVAEAVLGAVTSRPGLAELLSPEIRAKHPALFGGADTQFQDFRGAIRVVDGVIRADDIVVHAADYALLGNGGYGFDRSIDLMAKFVASSKLSADLISEVKAMKYLTNDAGRVQIPFRLTGVGDNVKVEPDGRFIAEALQRAAVGTVGDLLDGILGGKQGAVTPESAPSSRQGPAPVPSDVAPSEQAPTAQSEAPGDAAKKEKKRLDLRDLLGGFGIPVQ